MVPGLISERSYPWAVEPAGLNGSIRERGCLLLDTGHLRGRHVTPRAWQAGHGPQTNASKGVSKDTAAPHPRLQGPDSDPEAFGVLGVAPSVARHFVTRL